MPHISKTVRAESDRYEHWFYIAQDNISAADALLDGIEQRLRLLATQRLLTIKPTAARGGLWQVPSAKPRATEGRSGSGLHLSERPQAVSCADPAPYEVDEGTHAKGGGAGRWRLPVPTPSRRWRAT